MNEVRTRQLITKTARTGFGQGTQATDAVILGAGTSSTPYASSTANAKFIEFRVSTTAAASSDARAMYLRMAFDGEHASAGGDCLRAFSVVNENIGTAHGAHISLAYKAEAGGSETAGLGAAVRGTTHIPDIASWSPSGTVCAGMFEIYSDGDASDPAGLTELSFLRIANSGDTTGAADVDDDAFLFSLQGFTLDTGHTIGANTASSTTLDFANWVPIKIKIGATTHYLVAAQTISATGGG